MTEALSVALWPLIFLMRVLFEFYATHSGSYGLSLIALGATVAVAAHPLQHYGRKIEMRLSEKNTKIKDAIEQIDNSLPGEARFGEIEKIYQRHKFHPAHNMLAGSSFIAQLPFLLTAFLMFTGGALPAESSFLFLTDLSRPDSTVNIAGWRLNILPVLMLAFSLAESRFYYAGNRAGGQKFMVIAALIFLLAYRLPSGLVLYWIILSMTTGAIGWGFNYRRRRASILKRRAVPVRQPPRQNI